MARNLAKSDLFLRKLLIEIASESKQLSPLELKYAIRLLGEIAARARQALISAIDIQFISQIINGIRVGKVSFQTQLCDVLSHLLSEGHDSQHL